MPNYRRTLVPGGTYFFTVALGERRSNLLINYIDHLRAAFRLERQRRPFTLNAIVVLPDHLHCIWTLPPGDADFADRWRRIKAGFSRQIDVQVARSPSKIRKGERGIWQRRYWEHAIRDERDLHAHVDYIHYNPVKHGHVHCVVDWPYSSFHRYRRLGLLPDDWAGDPVSVLDAGE